MALTRLDPDSLQTYKFRNLKKNLVSSLLAKFAYKYATILNFHIDHTSLSLSLSLSLSRISNFCCYLKIMADDVVLEAITDETKQEVSQGLKEKKLS